MYHSAQPLQAGLGENSVLGTDCRFGARFLATAGWSAIYACAQKAGIAPQWERERRASAACQRAARPGGYCTSRAGPLETECAADFREFCHRQSQSARARGGAAGRQQPRTSYNPLFLYGSVGLGKTHVIHAIGNHLKHEKPAARIRYIHAEQYVSDVVKAYQRKAFDAFKR